MPPQFASTGRDEVLEGLVVATASLPRVVSR
jgi:hypothetical protein